MTCRFDLYVPVELVSEANQREHWAVKSKRKKRQRELVRLYWKLAGAPMIEPPVKMRLVRLHTSRRKIRDFDNLVGSFKAVIDEMAELLRRHVCSRRAFSIAPDISTSRCESSL